MKKSRNSTRNWHRYDPKEGLEVNAIHDNSKVSRYRSDMSIFDADNIAMDWGSRYKKISIMKFVRRINRKRSDLTNDCYQLINGG